jgi:probable F420-dependent oxidoreductase
VWATDHVVLPERVDAHYPYRAHGQWDYPPDTKWLDPLLALCWAAAECPSLKIGTSILVFPIRNPVLLAKQLATLDFLTGGRLVLGVGVGWMEEEFETIGEKFAGRGGRTVEMVKLMRRYWSGETVEFDGKFYSVPPGRMHPTPVQPTIPIYWGGHSEYALRRVARVGDGWHPTQITLEELEAGLDNLREKCAESERDFDSVTVVARPGNTYEITRETQARHAELGIDHLIVDMPIADPDPKLTGLREKMERVAEICDLSPR